MKFIEIGIKRMQARFFHVQLALIVGALLLSPVSNAGNHTSGSQSTEAARKQKMERFINDLLKRMTLEEKIGQMNQVGGTFANTGPINPLSDQGKEMREGKIGSVLNLAGVDGIRKIQKVAVEETRLHIPLIFGLDVIHGMKTIFPIPLGEAASWDLSAMERSARIAAIEASAMGVNWTFAPMLDIARDARWGRIAEGAGEDTYLGVQIAKARVKGFQGDDLSKNNTIAACAKHYAAYGAAIAGRDYNAVDMSEITLRDTYLPPFKAAVDAGAATFMSSFNTLNGVPATANEFLLRKVLKGEWNFNGFVVSDAGAVGELIPHGLAADGIEAARAAANAGLDMDMGSNQFLQNLPDLVRKGLVPEKVIDDAVRRILRIKYELGLFQDPYRYCDEQREKTELLTPEHVAAARDMARKSIVLLKNDYHLLPLKKSIGTLAVIGAMADSQGDMIGCWGGGGDAKDAVSILQGIRSAVSSQTKVLYAKGCEIEANAPEDFTPALDIARQADVVVMTLGESGGMTGEAHSRANINIPGNQEALLKEVIKLGKPVIVLLTNGRPLTISWVADNVPSIVETWFLGSQAGNAIADVLFGDYNPSGKLPVSFPRVLGQVPLCYNELNTGRPLAEHPGDFFRSRYNDVSNDALFPFGFGLSYTTFEYSNLRLSQNVLTKDGKLQVSVDVKNTGYRSGEELVQLYIRDYYASVCQPTRLLKGFKKLAIEPGQTKTVTLTLTPEDLKYHNSKMEWTVEPGKFGVFVGGNSQNTLNEEFVLK
ncbi:MAG: glycoside hydrolase family 3 N-terminal domain-containing protein [Bacteroidota bacterium]|nr:glycoside hydrolase family 3 N-terminal domain-containing protein [Bacteroidota bacterium]